MREDPGKIIAVTAGGRDNLPAENRAIPFISIVMPVRNEAATIEFVVTALLTQEYPPDKFEILVCDGYSTDDTAARVEKFRERDARVILLHNEGRRSSAGRNVGYRHARGDIIMFVDGHCIIPDRHLLQATAEVFASSGADCLCRPQPLAPDDTGGFWPAAIAAVRASRLGHSRSSYIFSEDEGFVSPASAGAIYKREVFEIIGEYDESFDACEDVEFNVRVEKAGLKSYISPRLRIFYHARRGLGSLLAQMSRYGQGRFRLFKKHPDTLEGQTLLPSLFLMACLFALLAVVFIPPLRVPILLVVLIGYLAAMAAVVWSTGQMGRRGWPVYPLVLFVIYWGLGWGFIRGVLVDGFAGAVRPDHDSGPPRQGQKRLLKKTR